MVEWSNESVRKTMASHKPGRLVRRLLWAAAAAVAISLAAMPIWFPWVVAGLFHRLGTSVDAYNRMGYSRVAFRGVKVQTPDGSLTADRVEIVLPQAWLWRRWFGQAGGRPSLSVKGWQVHVTPSQSRSKPPSIGSVTGLLDELAADLPYVRSWLTSARLSAGSVVTASGETDVPWVEWDGHILRGLAGSRPVGQTLELSVDLTAPAEWPVTLKTEPLGAAVRSRIFRSGRGWNTAGEITWRGNQAAFAAAFVQGRQLPAEARLDADSFHVPGDLLKDEGYSDLVGSLHLVWLEDRFQVKVKANAEPLNKDVPPVHAEVAAHGDLQAATVEALDVNSPWLQARLSDTFRVEYRAQRWLVTPATLRIRGNLDKLTLGQARGQFSGTVEVQPSDQTYPRLLLVASGQGLSSRGVEIKACDAKASMQWPRVDALSVNASLADGSVVTAEGALDLASKTVSRGEWQVSGPLARRFLPSEVQYDTLTSRGTCSGPWDHLIHAGELSLGGVRLPHAAVMEIRGQWKGEALDLSEVSLDAAAGQVSMQARGAARLAGESMIRVDQWTLLRDGSEVIRLTSPVRISLGQSGVVSVDGLHLRGAGRTLNLDGSVTWPQQGRLHASGSGIRLADLEGMIAGPLPDVTVVDLAVDASWDNGPLVATALGKVRISRQDGQAVSVGVQAKTDQTGLSLDAVRVEAAEVETVTLQGHVPAAIMPALWPEPWQEVSGQRLQLDGFVKPDPSFLQTWFERHGLKVVGPELRLALSGTLDEPQGRIVLTAQQIDAARWLARPEMPALDDLRLEVGVDRSRVAIHALSLNVAGQAVRATGQWPVPPGAWGRLFTERTLPDWRTASARLTIDRASLSAFTNPSTGVLLPQGTVNVDVTILPGGRIQGNVKVADAATRSFGSIPSVHDIQAEVRFEDRLIRLENWTANVGGQPVTLSGWARLNAGSQPEFELALKGRNVPLVRQAGLIVRSDLDVKVVQSGSEPAAVVGKMTFRDSLYVRDVQSSGSGGSGQSQDRPPYFSVPYKPFASWRLDLDLAAQRFMRVRTPWFSGEVSADFKLRGTLSEPVCTGEARADTGAVHFPFADFAIDRGLVELTPANPYQPRLDLTGTSRSYGYAIKLFVTGSARNPLISFSSTPAMSSEDILMMVTSGRLPPGGTSLTTQQRASQVAGFFARDLLSKISQDPASLDRLSVRSGEEMSETGQPTQVVEYQLDKRWSVYGEYDRFNQFNAGLKWRLYSK
jgi:translocation and assembly module TamB